MNNQSQGSAHNISSFSVVLFALFCLFALVFLQGCSAKSVKKAVPFMSSDSYLKLILKASTDINPNPAGRASPLNVKTYLLTSRTTFDNLRFDAAFEQAKVLLDDELLSQKEYIFQPGETVKYKIKISEDTRFVAVLAAYREMDKAKWKIVLPLEDEDQRRNVSLKKTSILLEKEKEEDEDGIVDFVEERVDSKVTETVDGELDKVF